MFVVCFWCVVLLLLFYCCSCVCWCFAMYCGFDVVLLLFVCVVYVVRLCLRVRVVGVLSMSFFRLCFFYVNPFCFIVCVWCVCVCV